MENNNTNLLLGILTGSVIFFLLFEMFVNTRNMNNIPPPPPPPPKPIKQKQNVVVNVTTPNIPPPPPPSNIVMNVKDVHNNKDIYKDKNKKK
jgi:hypothetical protein